MHVGHHFVAPLSSSRRHHCLTCAGAQGLLRDQEAELFRLREEKEGQVHNLTGSNEWYMSRKAGSHCALMMRGLAL